MFDRKRYFSNKYAKKFGVKNYAMSFVNNQKDTIFMRKIIGKKSFLISKIETLNAIKNLKNIKIFKCGFN